MPFPLPQPGAGASGPQQSTVPTLGAAVPDMGMASALLQDGQYLTLWKRWKQESFDQRNVYERQWLRNIFYILNRQWIYYDNRRGQWQDKRLAKWVPRPVTNICKEAVQAVRANFAAINYGTNARPLGEDNLNIITAGVADDYAPILHEDHQMDAVMNEFDFNLLVYGNAWLHTCVEFDRANGVVSDEIEVCATCQAESQSSAIANAGQKCPACSAPGPFLPSGKPPVQTPQPKGTTLSLSPFEIAFPLVYERYSLAPYTIRIRWRDKSHYEQHEELQQYAKTLTFSKSPQERTMQIFKTLPYQNDLGISNSPYFGAGGGQSEAEGIVEYDIWVKPCADFPEGQVIRIAGDTNPTVIHSEKESLPGPLPYTNAKGNPLFTFHHARFDQVGGRALGSGLIDPIIQKQDQLNQLDSHMLMIIGRMANPIWLEPKGAEVEKFTGEPGLVVKWNPLVAGGNAKPERIPGEGINPSVFQYRAIIKTEAEELSGTFDLMKGAKPSGVEAYAALSLLKETGQARFTSAFKERGAAYKGWFADALEIERMFGPDKRIQAVMQPTRAWAFETFKKADLSGSVEIIIEDGTLSPKTSLGERAAIEHLRQLGLLNPQDPDQVMAIFEKFGQSRLLPGLDAQVQEAWLNMDKFEKFVTDPAAIQAAVGGTGKEPLVYKRWYNPQIHRQELIKWCLSDRGRAVFDKNPGAEQYVDMYLAQIDMAIAQAAMGMMDAAGVAVPTAPGAGGPPQAGGAAPPQAGGAGAAMANSNRNAAGAGPQSSGAASSGGSLAAGSPQQQASDSRAINYLQRGN